jgi:hypothetical protein
MKGFDAVCVKMTLQFFGKGSFAFEHFVKPGTTSANLGKRQTEI